MHVVRIKWVCRICARMLTVLCLLPVALFAETAHVVSPAELQLEAAKASQLRQQNMAKVRNFIATPAGSDALSKAHMDLGKVQAAIAELDDQELSQLAARADKAQQDFAAGNLTTRDIALIILGVVLLILIIVVAR